MLTCSACHYAPTGLNSRYWFVHLECTWRTLEIVIAELQRFRVAVWNKQNWSAATDIKIGSLRCILLHARMFQSELLSVVLLRLPISRGTRNARACCNAKPACLRVIGCVHRLGTSHIRVTSRDSLVDISCEGLYPRAELSRSNCVWWHASLFIS